MSDTNTIAKALETLRAAGDAHQAEVQSVDSIEFDLANARRRKAAACEKLGAAQVEFDAAVAAAKEAAPAATPWGENS